MDVHPRITDVVIPARNEADNILHVIAPFEMHRDIGYIHVGIDPETSDATSSIIRSVYFKNPKVHVIYPEDAGKGQVVSETLKYVDTERVIFCDADIRGLLRGHVDRLLAPSSQESLRHQLILVPRYPGDVPDHVTMAWPWISGIRNVPYRVVSPLLLHGYLMEVQINKAIAQGGGNTRFFHAHDVDSPYNMTKQRRREMERDRRWGKANGILD